MSFRPKPPILRWKWSSLYTKWILPLPSQLLYTCYVGEMMIPCQVSTFQSLWGFVRKPSYFEGDGPVCTRSVSSFCRNPLNFCTHAMWVKWWYHAKFQPFQSSWVFVWNGSYFEVDGRVCTRSVSSFCRNPLNFCTHAMWVKWWYHTKFQPFRVDEFSPETPHTSKEMV